MEPYLQVFCPYPCRYARSPCLDSPHCHWYITPPPPPSVFCMVLLPATQVLGLVCLLGGVTCTGFPSWQIFFKQLPCGGQWMLGAVPVPYLDDSPRLPCLVCGQEVLDLHSCHIISPPIIRPEMFWSPCKFNTGTLEGAVLGLSAGSPFAMYLPKSMLSTRSLSSNLVS